MVYGVAEIVRQVKDLNNRKSIAKNMIEKFKRENNFKPIIYQYPSSRGLLPKNQPQWQQKFHRN